MTRFSLNNEHGILDICMSSTQVHSLSELGPEDE